MTAPAQSTDDAHHLRTVRTVFAGLMLGMLLAAVSQTIISPAMPRIVADLGGMEHYGWIAVSTLLASTVVVPIVGKLSDLFGRKAFYVGGIVVFMLASVLAGVAPNFETFMAARVLEGFGMGTMMPLSQAIIGDLIPARERGKYQGLMGATYGLASIVGPFVGGWITEHLTWRWLFFVNVPVGLVALGFIVPFMHLPHTRRAHVIDYKGIVTLTIGLTSTLLATVWGGTEFPWRSAPIIGLYAIGTLSLAAFVVVERDASEPVLPLRLWRSRIFASANVASMAVAMSMFGAIYFIPMFVQGVIGTSVAKSGAVLTPMLLAMVVMSAVNGQIISRTGRYKVPILVGVGFLAVGYVFLSRMGRTTTEGTVVRNMILVGIGLGMAMQTFTLVVQNAVSREDMGVATAATQLFRSIGSTLGIAILGTLMAHGMAREIPRRVAPGELAAVARATHTSPGAAAEGGAAASALLDPETLAMLSPDARDRLRDGLSATLVPVFTAGLPFVLIAFLASLAIPEVPLRRTVPADAREAGREVLTGLAQTGEDDEIPALGEDSPLYCERSRLVGTLLGEIASRAGRRPDSELARVLARIGDGDMERGRQHMQTVGAALVREGGGVPEATPQHVGDGAMPAERPEVVSLLERILQQRPAELEDRLRAVVRRQKGDARGLTPADLETLERVAMLAAAALLIDESRG